MLQVGRKLQLAITSLCLGGIGLAVGWVLAASLSLPAQARAGAQGAPTVAPEAVTTPAPTPLPTATVSTTLTTPHSLTYTVRAGDTILTLALEIGVDVDDMPCILTPDFDLHQPLVIGDVLTLPPAGLLCHAVQAGESLASIAGQYKVAAADIQAVAWNRLPAKPDVNAPLAPPMHLRIPLALAHTRVDRDSPAGLTSTEDFLTYMLQQPVNTSPFVALAVGGGGRPPHGPSGALPQNWPYGSGHFAWPLYGWLTQGYRFDHRAVDIAAPVGTVVSAADRGVVIRAGWNDQGYGLFVIIDHNIDYVTLYAHLSEIFVSEGEVVAQGQAVGRVGSTGNSTGPHLHFEIRDFGRLTNPLELLGRHAR